MRRPIPFLLAITVWIIALAVILAISFETFGQGVQVPGQIAPHTITSTGTIAVYDSVKNIHANPWRVGDRFTVNATGQFIPDTNAPPAISPVVVVPLVDRIQEWADAAQNIAIGIGAVLLSLAGIWISIKTKLATAFKDQAEESGAISKVLIKEVQKVATKDFKNTIASAAREAGVGDALHDLVKENTPSTGVPPRDYAAELKSEPFPLKPVTLPVVEPPKPI